ncbi:MAG: YfhO family protein [Chitinophagaceae bacterium]|jgi:hypothetical protein|nr:YfhO family protein [Chitinophagaceae bacterium]
MKNFNWKNVYPHLIAIGVFLLAAIIYCMPAMKGMMVNMNDGLAWRGMAQQSFEFKEKYGHFPFWTNSMFGGMPAYQIAGGSTVVISLYYFQYIMTLGLPEPVSLFFIASVCFYMLCCTLRMRPLVGVIVALAYTYASYNAIIVNVGHVTKFAAMGYAPAVIAGLLLLTQRKYALGFIVTLIFSALFLYANHLQIVYYTFLTCIFLGVFYAVYAIKHKEIKHLLTVVGLAAIAGGIAAATYLPELLPTNEYAKESMRGGRSELTISDPQGANKNVKTKGGLDKDYAFNWSYGIGETMTFILPAYRGGSSGPTEFGSGENSKAVEAMRNAGFPENAIENVYGYLSAYWGEQTSGTSGPVFFGVLICLFFIMGLFIVKDWNKGWIIAATVLGLILAWGKNFQAINYFLVDHLPFYNKFRAPSMAMVIPQLTFSLLAGLALQTLCYGNIAAEELKKKLKWTGIAAGAVVLILLFTYVSSSFKSESDKNLKTGLAGMVAQMMGNNPNAQDQATATANSIMSGLSADRKALYGGDLLRVLFLTALGAAIVWLLFKKKIKPEYALAVIGIATLIDLITVDSRYLKTENYIDKDEFMAPYTATTADLQIKKDTSFYRVYDQSMGSPWSDFSGTRAAYHHNAIGGYHAAKLALYQDLIDNQLSKGNMRVFDMLNTKYFINNNPSTRQPAAQLNNEAWGNAWLVKSIQPVPNADAEMKALDSITKDVAIVDKRELSKIKEQPQYDSTAEIKLVQNKNDYIHYAFNASKNQFAVFSEIYYPYGWTAAIDGKAADIVRVNYLLRGLSVPAGKHDIVFEFKPKSVALGAKYANIGAALAYLSMLIALFLLWKQSKKKTA